MITLQKSIGLVLIILTGLLLSNLETQEDSIYWVYEVSELEDAYEIIRTNAITNTREMIVSVSKAPSFSLASIMPAEELVVAEHFLALDAFNADKPEGFVYDYFNRPPMQSYLTDIAPSSDNKTLAMAIVHHRCTTYPRMVCFGVSQIVLFTVETGGTEVLWTIPEQAKTPFYPSCNSTEYIYSEGSSDVGIIEIRWTPDNQAIVASLHYGRSYTDYPLVVIPINSPERAFTIGNGRNDWAIAPNSQEITTLSWDCSSDSGESLNIINFDLNTGVTSQTTHSLLEAPEYGFIDGLDTVYFRNQTLLHFRVSTAAVDFARLAVFNHTDETISAIANLQIHEYRQIQSSRSTEIIVLQDKDGLLWKLISTEETLDLQPITDIPVTFWQFANENELIVQFEGTEQYTVVEIPLNIT